MENPELAVATVGLPANEANYYLSIAALTPKDVNAQSPGTTTADTMPIVSPYVIWAPFGIFFILFIAAFGIMIANKVWNWKRAASALVLGLCLASIPFVTSSFRDGGVTTQFQAGPEEIPRQVTIEKQTADGVLVSWTTDKESVGAVRFGVSPLNTTTAKVLFADAGQKTGKHAVKITSLKLGGVYELEVYSNAKWYTDRGKPLRFTLSR